MATIRDPFFYFHPSDRVTATTITAQTGTEDTAYPLTNAEDFSYKNLANPSKLNETTGAWQFDFSTPTPIAAAVLWSNFDPALTIGLQKNAAASWGGPTVNGSIVMPDQRADFFTRKVWIDFRSVGNNPTGGLRYLRVNVPGTNSEPLGLKILFYSQIRQLSRDVQFGREDEDHQIGIDMKTDAGFPWAYNLTSAPRSIVGTALLSDSDAEAVREWHRSCAGCVTPTVIIPDPAGSVLDAWLVRWQDGGFSIQQPSVKVSSLPTSKVYTDANLTRMAFEEITAGDPEWS